MNIKAVILGAAIFILTMFVTTYGVDTFYSEPQYDDFCSNSIWEVNDMTEAVCFENGGKWTSYTDKVDDGPTGHCDRDFSCRKAYNLSQERYSMNVFLLAIPLGILVLFLGFYFFNLEPVGVGIMAAGVGTLLRGISSYWRYSEDWLRFVISLAGLLIVIFFSYRYSDKFHGSSKVKSKKKK